MSGRSIGSLTAGWTVAARDQACYILLSGKGLITPPTRQVGNHLNTWQMHPNWSRHSTKLTQLSRPPRFIARGHCLIGFLVTIFFYFTDSLSGYLQVRSFPFQPPRHIPHHTLNFGFPSQYFSHCPLLTKHRGPHDPRGLLGSHLCRPQCIQAMRPGLEQAPHLSQDLRITLGPLGRQGGG